jgi:hypothetical protein
LLQLLLHLERERKSLGFRMQGLSSDPTNRITLSRPVRVETSTIYQPKAQTNMRERGEREGLVRGLGFRV